jgi:hypothetical protein
MENQPIFTGRDINTGAISLLRITGQTLLTTAGNINDLDDVVITEPVSNNQLLKYNTSTSKWENNKANISELADVGITGTIAFNSYLRYQTGSTNKWVNVEPDYMSFVMYGTLATGNFSVSTDRQILISSATYWSGTPPNPANGVGGYTTGLNAPYGYNATTGVISVNPNKRYMVVATYNESGANINTPTNFEIGLVNWTTGSATNFVTGASGGARTVFTQQLDFAGVSASVSYAFINVSAFSFVLRTVTSQAVAISGTDCNININLWEI